MDVWTQLSLGFYEIGLIYITGNLPDTTVTTMRLIWKACANLCGYGVGMT